MCDFHKIKENIVPKTTIKDEELIKKKQRGIILTFQSYN